MTEKSHLLIFYYKTVIDASATTELKDREVLQQQAQLPL